MNKKILLLAIVCFFITGTKAQLMSEIAANPGTSGNVPFGTSNYAAGESIYTENEIGASNFTTAGTAITSVAFDVNTVGATTTFNNVKIYFKDVPLATSTLATGTYTTAGYTLVFNGSVAMAAAGWNEILLTAPYVRTSGTNLQMLVERTDAVTHTGFIWNCAVGNDANAAAASERRYNSTTALSAATSLSASTFREAIRLIHRYNNDANVASLYTLGKIPVPNGTPHTISANISNEGLNALTNLSVTLNVTGANTFTNTKVIASLASLANTDITFNAFTPTVEGVDIVTVTVTADDFSGNNSNAVTQIVNKNTWSYVYDGGEDGGVGFTGATGDFVAKFSTSLATAVAQVSVDFAAGGQPFQIGIWDATGAGGTPGANLYTSAFQTSAMGVNVLPVIPAVNIPVGSFYVGVKQTGTTNVNFGYQVEEPIRAGTFFFTTPTGGTTWTDFSPGNPFRFMIEPKLILPTDASVSILITPDNITCFSTPQTYTALLANTGSNPIAIGAAAVTLHVGGANVFAATTHNTTSIASGGTELISFNTVNIPNPGINFDTVFVVLAGDVEHSNDTATSGNLTSGSISSFPFSEKFESASFGFEYLDLVAGGGRNITDVQTGTYTNVDLGGDLDPHSADNMILFDNYSGVSSAGVINRLFSDCISLPANGAGQCGNYQLSFWMSHDTSFNTSLDSMYVTITTNGGTTWTRVSPGFRRYDPTFIVPGWKKQAISLNAYAGQTIQIGFEDVSDYGNIIALDDIEVGSTAAGGVRLSTVADNGVSLIKSCDDQGWTYYVDPSSLAQPLFAIQWDPGSTGANVAAKAAAIPKIQLDPAYFSAENIPAKKATYTMRRYWDVNLGVTSLTSPVNVRFFYDSTEKDAVTMAAQTFAAANSGAVEPPTWFKTRNAAFVPNSTNVTPEYVTQSPVPLTDVSAGATINGVRYAQFNAVTSFSGGTYATGVGINLPIPIKIEYLTGAKQGNNNVLNWKVICAGSPNATLVLERSGDARTFTRVYGITATALRCLQPFDYTDHNPLPGVNYYRLSMTEDNGIVSYSPIVTLFDKNSGLDIVNITPNPVTGETFKLNIYAAKQTAMELVITDIVGRVMQKQHVILTPGFNAPDIKVAGLAGGSYSIYGISAEGKTRTVGFVKGM